MSEDNTGQETTVTEPVVEDDKPKTVPYERLSEVVAQKNAALEAATKATEELKKINEDRDKVRKAELEKQGEYKTLLEEANAKVETLTTELGGVKTKWDEHEAKRRETINSIPGLTDDDKKLIATMGIDTAEQFANRVTDQPIKTGTDSRRSTSSNGDKKPLGSFANMSDQERRDTHAERLAQYEK